MEIPQRPREPRESCGAGQGAEKRSPRSRVTACAVEGDGFPRARRARADRPRPLDRGGAARGAGLRRGCVASAGAGEPIRSSRCRIDALGRARTAFTERCGLRSSAGRRRGEDREDWAWRRSILSSAAAAASPHAGHPRRWWRDSGLGHAVPRRERAGARCAPCGAGGRLLARRLRAFASGPKGERGRARRRRSRGGTGRKLLQPRAARGPWCVSAQRANAVASQPVGERRLRASGATGGAYSGGGPQRRGGRGPATMGWRVDRIALGRLMSI